LNINRFLNWGRAIFAQSNFLKHCWQKLVSFVQASVIRRNLLSLYTTYVINGILSIIVIPIAIHYLGTGGYGLFAVYGVLAGYVGLIDLGVTRNLVRLLAGNSDAARRITYLRTAFTFYLLAGASVLILLPFFLYIIPRYIFPVDVYNRVALPYIICLASLEYILAIPTTMIQSVAIAEERIHQYALFTAVSGLYRYGLLLCGVVTFANCIPLIVALLVSRRVVDFFVGRWLMGRIPNISFRPVSDLRSVISMAKHSFLLGVTQFLQLTTVNVGAFLVNLLWGLDALGIVRGAWDLASRIVFVANGLGQVVFPRFVRMMTTDLGKKQLKSRLPPLLSISWAMYSGMACLGILLGCHFLDILSLRSKIFHDIFLLLFVGTCFGCHAILSLELIQATGRYMALLFLNSISVVVVVIVALAGSLHAGFVSIGLGWIASQVLLAIAGDTLASKILTVPISNILAQIAIKVLIFIGVMALVAGALMNFGLIHLLSCSLMCLLGVVVLYGLRREGFMEIVK
jgi:O-antigen/teichoic acid export membrane protein